MKKIFNPPDKIQTLSLKERNLIYQSIIERNEEGILWLEKLRKFVSFHNRNLRKISKKRFMGDSDSHLLWFREIFINQIILSKDLQIDSGLLNATLIANDSCPNDFKYDSKLKSYLKNLESKLIESLPINFKDSNDEFKLSFSYSNWTKNNLQKNPVTIFCPSPYSLFSISVINLCMHLDIPIKAVFILKFTSSRIKSELYRDGAYLFLKRVWRKLILKSDENSDQALISMKFLKNQLSPNYSDIREITKLHDIKSYSVINFEACLSLAKNKEGDVCLFTGGGLVNSNIIDYFEHGIINVHMGPLPEYKGMDVVEAPILDGRFNEIALTSHLMKKDLDSGPIINKLHFSSDEYKSIGELRNEMGGLMPILAIDALIKLFKNDFKPIPQTSSGQQFYFIHSELRKIIDKVIFNRFHQERLKNNKFRRENLKLFSLVLKEISQK